MARHMWPSDAVVPYSVRATYAQSASWRYAASVKGLAIPVFLAHAADDYADRLKKQLAREEQREAKR